MDVLGQHLEVRTAAAGQAAHQANRDAGVLDWLNQGRPPEERLIKFDTWVRRELAQRIDWTWAGPDRERRIEQCRVHLERLVLELWRRGWMLDGERLAGHIRRALDQIASYQRKGAVADFWPYFRACVDRYVGINAEEIRAEAMRAGSHVGQVLELLRANRQVAGPPLPELLAQRAEEIGQARTETLRQKIARQRRRQAACKANAGQGQLL